MKDRAAGILIEDEKVLLIHRTRERDGAIREYYVVPGGGIEEGETIEEATKREVKEETGIDVELIESKPKYVLKEEERTQFFSMVKRIGGEIGTGEGPEFTDAEYKERGTYSPEMVLIKDIVKGKANMVPIEIKEQFIKDFGDK